MTDAEPGLDVDLRAMQAAIEETEPLVNAVTNAVTVNAVANTVLHWGGLPVMSDDRREVADMVATAQACLLNTGDVSEDGEETMLTAGRAANDAGIPIVLDPVGVGATPTRTAVTERLVSELDVAVVKGNYGEISALAGDAATVRGVESIGEYDGIAATALACAHETGAAVVASGEVDVVADAEAAYEVRAGDPMLGRVVGTGCMLGAALSVVAPSLEDPLSAALAGTCAFGIVAERAADGEYGEYAGPASYETALLDAMAGFDGTNPEEPGTRVRRVAEVE